MNILILGYGKMGRAIERVAGERGHAIAYKINLDNLHEMAQIDPARVDVAIEFSSPESAIANIQYCFAHRIPVVCGTTGWLQHREEIEQTCRQTNGAFFYASNFSLGVNLFFHLNRLLAGLMNRYPAYDVTMEEIHHTEKLDAPSGTALTLATDVLARNDRKKRWVNAAPAAASDLSIISRREGNVPGTHRVRYDSPVDTLEITHTAHTRDGFALGAVLAAEWLPGKTGVFGMNDLLNV